VRSWPSLTVGLPVAHADARIVVGDGRRHVMSPVRVGVLGRRLTGTRPPEATDTDFVCLYTCVPFWMRTTDALRGWLTAPLFFTPKRMLTEFAARLGLITARADLTESDMPNHI
jgi:hypothetical protein